MRCPGLNSRKSAALGSARAIQSTVGAVERIVCAGLRKGGNNCGRVNRSTRLAGRSNRVEKITALGDNVATSKSFGPCDNASNNVNNMARQSGRLRCMAGENKLNTGKGAANHILIARRCLEKKEVMANKCCKSICRPKDPRQSCRMREMHLPTLLICHALLMQRKLGQWHVNEPRCDGIYELTPEH